MNLLEETRKTQIDRLEQSRKKLIDFSLNEQFLNLSFCVAEIADNQGIEHMANTLADQGRFIYYFFSPEPQSIVDSFRSYSNPSNKRSRFNDKHSITPFLYVGSSKNLRKRFKEHCGICNEATYALKFRDWLTDFPAKIEFHYCQIHTEDQEILQNLEDGLWLSVKPIFGKYGGKY